MERQIKNLDELMDGAMTERFQQHWDKVMQNVFDPNTDPKAKRQITVVIDITPNERRDAAEYSIDFKTKMAPMRKLAQTIFLHMDDHGKVTATEVTQQIPGQISMDGSEQAIPKVIEFGQVSKA